MASRGEMYNRLDGLDAIGTFIRATRMRFGMTQEDMFLQLFEISPVFQVAWAHYMDDDEEEGCGENYFRRQSLVCNLELGKAGRQDRGVSFAFWGIVYQDICEYFNIEPDWIVYRKFALITTLELEDGLILHANRNKGDCEYILFVLETLG